MLTPDRKLEYDLRKSPTAANLRLQLDGFEPTRMSFGTSSRRGNSLMTNTARCRGRPQ